jgi:hypothetical protein
MLPEDCKDCPVCGVPMTYYGAACDGCHLAAAERLGLTITKGKYGYAYTDPKSGKNAYWRVIGLLKQWST